MVLQLTDSIRTYPPVDIKGSRSLIQNYDNALNKKSQPVATIKQLKGGSVNEIQRDIPNLSNKAEFKSLFGGSVSGRAPNPKRRIHERELSKKIMVARQKALGDFI